MTVIKLASSTRSPRTSLTPMEERVVRLFRAVPDENRTVFLDLIETIYRSCDWRAPSGARSAGDGYPNRPPSKIGR